MERIRLHPTGTMLDVMERVLDKGIVVEPLREADAGRRRRSMDGIGLFGVDAYVEVVTDVDGMLRKVSGA
jgi:hypothetical protein